VRGQPTAAPAPAHPRRSGIPGTGAGRHGDARDTARRRGEELGTVPAPHENRLDPAIAARLRRDAQGLVAAIVQQHDTGEVLMLAWMDDEALHRTLTTGRATYWSRSRREYWVKGATSGHHQHVKSVTLDCDGDAVLVSVDQVGAACHAGTRTCFTDELPAGAPRGGQA